MTELPLWVSLPAAALIVCAGLLAAIGCFGLVRLDNFFARMHPPTMGTTLGTGCLLLASMMVSTALRGQPVVHELLITLFIVFTTPVNAMLLVRAARYRSERRGASSQEPAEAAQTAKPAKPAESAESAETGGEDGADG